METKLTVRCEEEDRAAWKEAAWKRKVPLSEWVRVVLNQAAARTKGTWEDEAK